MDSGIYDIRPGYSMFICNTLDSSVGTFANVVNDSLSLYCLFFTVVAGYTVNKVVSNSHLMFFLIGSYCTFYALCFIFCVCISLISTL